MVALPNSLPNRERRLDGSVVDELRGFYKDAHQQALWLVGMAFWFCGVDASRLDQTSAWPVLTAIVLLMGIILSLIMRTLHSNNAPAVLAIFLALGYFTTILTYPSAWAYYLGVPVVLLCNGMLPSWQSGIVTIVLLVELVVVRTAVPSGAVGLPVLIAPVLLVATTSVMSWLSRKRLLLALAWAQHSTTRAQSLADILRERQLLLNRTLRAMEEATYRIERTNNELLLAQREAETARIAKTRFTATVSHEIRGPLNLLLGFSRLMALSPERYGPNLTSAYYTDVDTIYRNTQHLCSLVDDVLDLSRIESDHLPLDRELVDFHQDILVTTLDSIRPVVEQKGLYLRTELADQVSLVLVDAIRMRQVLLNLLTNATRFTPRGGITVRSQGRQDMLLITVEDTGPGIAPEDVPKLFKEFSQLRGGKTRSEGGSGLGLSIARHLVDAHGGAMWAESRLGYGTTIAFTVPLAGGEPGPDPLVRTGGPGRKATQRRSCVVVHDDPYVVRLLARHMEGYQVVGLRNEGDVRRLAEDLHPQAIVTTPARAERVTKELMDTPLDIPVISFGLPSASAYSTLEGVLGYLVKPIGQDELGALMGQIGGQIVTILVVDDEPDAVRLVETMLTSTPYPYRVVKAYDGLEALRLMRSELPDVVILDWFMPQLDGGQTIAHMRADPELRSIPVIVVSARDWIEDQAVIGMPINVGCRKPLPIARGVKCLQSLLDSLSPDYVSGSVSPEPPQQGAP